MSFFRKQRGKSQRIFLINQEIHPDNTGTFAVAGTTGNVYHVEIKETTSCSCPDHKIRRRRCKHIYFILIRILKVSVEQEDQEKYDEIDRQTMFGQAKKVCKALLVTPAQRDAYIEEAKKNMDKDKEASDGKVQMKSTDDDCLICFDPLTNGDKIIYCQYSCGKPIHEECLQIWSKAQKKTDLHCLYCHKSLTKAPTQTAQPQYFNMYSKFTKLGNDVMADEDNQDDEDEYEFMEDDDTYIVTY